MRIEGIEPNVAMLAANRASYAELMGLSGKVTTSSLDDNSGSRYLMENRWGGLDMHALMKHLNVGKNKLMILQLLKRGDLMSILRLLDKDQLLHGLRFFSKQKLMQFLTFLPKRMHIKMVLHLWGMDNLIQKLPPRELFSILRSRRLPMREMVKGFATMPKKFLNFMMGKIMNRNLSHLSQREMLTIFRKLKKRMVLDGMRFLPYKALTPLVNKFAQKDPELLLHISGAFLFKLFDKMPKPMLIEGFSVLQKEMLVQFLGNLPDKQLVAVAAQLDDSAIEQYLLSEQSGLLAMLGADLAA